MIGSIASTKLGFIFRTLMAAIGLGLIVVIIAANFSDRMVLPQGAYYNEAAAEMVEVPKRQTVAILERTDWGIGVEWPADSGETGLVLNRSAIGGPGEAYVQAGMVTTLGQARHGLLLGGLVLVGLTLPLQAWRWLVLMRCRGLCVSFRWAFRLTMVGQFFNVSMPGATGGDVLKAAYAASKPGQRATAVMSVMIDRMAGLIGLVLLAGLAGFWSMDRPLIRWITLGIWITLGLVLTGFWLYISPTLRKRLRLRRLVERMPFQKPLIRFDEAAVAYRSHLGTVVGAVFISLPIHLALIGSTILAGKALGIDGSPASLLALLPLAFLLASVPIAPAGLGVMEGTAVVLIHAPPTEVLGMMLIFRLFQIAYALIGWAAMFRGNMALHAPEIAKGEPA